MIEKPGIDDSVILNLTDIKLTRNLKKLDPEKQTKLRTYSKFKNKLLVIFEPYLDKRKKFKRTCLKTLKISAHEPKIERGRYSRKKMF